MRSTSLQPFCVFFVQAGVTHVPSLNHLRFPRPFHLFAELRWVISLRTVISDTFDLVDMEIRTNGWIFPAHIPVSLTILARPCALPHEWLEPTESSQRLHVSDSADVSIHGKGHRMARKLRQSPLSTLQLEMRRMAARYGDGRVVSR